MIGARDPVPEDQLSEKERRGGARARAEHPRHPG
jgi:hypothetical protein